MSKSKTSDSESYESYYSSSYAYTSDDSDAKKASAVVAAGAPLSDTYDMNWMNLMAPFVNLSAAGIWLTFASLIISYTQLDPVVGPEWVAAWNTGSKTLALLGNAFCSGFCQISAGPLSNRFGRKNIIGAGLVIQTLAALVGCIQVPGNATASSWMIAVAFLMSGVGTGIAGPPSFVYAQEGAPDLRAKIRRVNFVTIATMISAVFGVIATLIFSSITTNGVLGSRLCMACMLVIDAVGVFFAYTNPDTPFSIKNRAENLARKNNPDALAKNAQKPKVWTKDQKTRAIFVCVLQSCNQFAVVGLLVSSPFIVGSVFTAETMFQVSWQSGIVYVVAVISSLGCMWAIKKYQMPMQRALMYGAGAGLVCAIALTITAFVAPDQSIAIFVLFNLTMACFGFPSIAAFAMSVQIYNPETRAMGTAIAGGCGKLGSAIGSAVLPQVLFASEQGLGIVYLIASIFILITFSQSFYKWKPVAVVVAQAEIKIDKAGNIEGVKTGFHSGSAIINAKEFDSDDMVKLSEHFSGIQLKDDHPALSKA